MESFIAEVLKTAPLAGVVLVVGWWFVSLMRADSAAFREDALSYRRELVDLSTSTLVSLNSNTKAMEGMQMQMKEQHTATLTLLDQMMQERCVEVNCPDRRQTKNGADPDYDVPAPPSPRKSGIVRKDQIQ